MSKLMMTKIDLFLISLSVMATSSTCHEPVLQQEGLESHVIINGH